MISILPADWAASTWNMILFFLHSSPISSIGWITLSEDNNFITSIYRGTYETYNLSAKILSYLGKLIAGRESIDQMGGPIKIIQISGEISNYGIIPLLALIAAISVNLGIINLLPIPVLDGGHLLYYSLEVVRGKPLSQKTQEIGMQIGMSLLIALMIFVTFLDISRL